MKMSHLYIYPVLVLFAIFVASCSKDDVPESPISITIEQPSLENAFKTTLGTPSDGIYPIYWLPGDEIAVNHMEGTSYAIYTNYAVDPSAEGTFNKKSGANIASFIPVYAYFPANNVVSVNGSKYTVTIPQTQQEGFMGSFNMPMYGHANILSELNSMTPLMSALKITLQGNCKVKSILLESPSINLSGTAEVDMTTGTLTFTKGFKQVLYSCDLAVSISTACSFIIAVPATAAAVTDFTVTITDSKGWKMKKNLSTSTNFKAKVIKNISSTLPVTTSCEFMDLGLSVKWALSNVGASKPEEPGDFFAWGETEPYYHSFSPLTWKTGKTDGYAQSSYFDYQGTGEQYNKYHVSQPKKVVLELDDDAAYVNCGTDCRMPTKDEIQELIQDCNWELTTVNGKNGYKVSAKKTGYEGNSIFLPVAGYISGTIYYNYFGLYWSNELASDSFAYGLNTNNNDLVNVSRIVGGSIRPVHP